MTLDDERNTFAQIVVQNKIKHTPKVSIIIPVFNVEQYIPECLNTVLNQTLKEIEVICIDDGSTDNSLNILKEYATKDDRITIISRENMGVGYSRNQGIVCAKGEFLAFMDPDDYYPSSDVLEVLYTNAVRNNVSICGGGLVVYDEKEHKEIYKKDFFNYFTDNKLWLYQDFQYDYGYQRFIYKTDQIKQNKIYFPNYRRFQDPPFMIKAFIQANSFFAVSNYTYGYRWAHKEVNWTKEKVLHLLQGLRDNLLMTIWAQLDKLYELTLNRIQREYKKVIMDITSDEIKEVKKEIMNICIQHTHDKSNYVNPGVKVSVIVPIYNAEPFLRECLDSIVTQTLKDIEVICVNDGSTDGSLYIMKEYAKKDNRIKYINKPNAGYGHAVNCGLDLATGEYIGIVEPDDFIDTEMYEVLYNKAKTSNLDVVKSDYYAFSKNNSEYINVVGESSYDININRKINRNLIGFTLNPTGIFRKQFLDRYKIRFNETPGAAHQDIGFSFLTSFFANDVQYLHIAFYHYRQDNENSSMRKLANPNIMLDEYDFIYHKLQEYPLIFNDIKDIFYQRRHNSFMYFGNNRISDCAQVYFWDKVQQVYTKDLKYGLLQLLQDSQQKEAQNILKTKPIIPVFCSTDDNYIPYLSVMLLSIKKHMSTKYKYVIHVLYTDITDENQQLLRKISGDGLDILFVNVADEISNQNLYTLAHFSKEMYYRLLIPELFSFYEKVVYLDCDLLIQQDIAKLYENNVDACIMGAIFNPPNTQLSNYKKSLNLDENKYFNSGVLVLNVKEFNKEHIKQKAFDFLRNSDKHLKFPDQDLLNILCKDKVRLLDPKWNFQWGYLFNTGLLPQKYVDNYIDTSKKPYIVHYTTGSKAWNKMHPLAKVWWIYAKESPFYDKIKTLNKVFIQKRVLGELNTSRIDIKNFGGPNNDVLITALGTDISEPAWFTNSQGIGKIVLVYGLKQDLFIKTKNTGLLRIEFRSIHKSYNNEPVPIWIDYKSIKIDGKEILSKPVSAWHNKPYRHEISVKEGQEINISIERQYHKYSKDELKDILTKLYTNDEYFINNISSVFKELTQQPLSIDTDEVIKNLTSYRIDIKNLGIDTNSVKVLSDGNIVDHPKWFTNQLGIGTVIHGDQLAKAIKLKIINDGNLHINFMGPDKRYNEERFPLWIDYKSIKVDGKEILSGPISTWHDKPYKYAMPVKDGQEILIEIEQQYHEYTEKELKDVICKLTNVETIYQEFKKKAPCVDKEIPKEYEDKISNVIWNLTTYRIDIKNSGTITNSLKILSDGNIINQPKWFTDQLGIGTVIHGDQLAKVIKLKIINDGKLQIYFRGPDKRYDEKRFPLWIDYRSIKIDGKEILSDPVSVWHDKPYYYEMPVKDGQEIVIEIEQQYHEYTDKELKDVICKLNIFSADSLTDDFINTIHQRILTKTRRKQ